MTCIVGYIDRENSRVIMGGDSAGVTGYDLIIRKDPKVFRNKEFVIGCTSSFRMIQLLRFSFVPPDINEKEVYEYMCTDFVDAVREIFVKGGYLKKESKGDDCGGHFLVAYKERLFHIQEDFQVEESYDDFNSIGVGSSFAIGAFHAIKDSKKMTCINKVHTALEIAEKCSIGVSSPFVFLKT